MYGKLIEGNRKIAPKKLNGDGVVVYNPPAKMYREQGWKEVIVTHEDAPEGYYFEEEWVEKETTIEIKRTLVPIPDEISNEEAYDIIFGGGE